MKKLPLLERLCMTPAVTQSGSARNTKTPRRFSSYFISSSSTGPIYTVWSKKQKYRMIGTNQTWIEHERFKGDCGIFDIRVSECARAAVKPFSCHSVFITAHEPSHRALCVLLCVRARECIRDLTLLHTCTSSDLIYADVWVFMTAVHVKSCSCVLLSYFWTFEYSFASFMCVLMMMVIQDWYVLYIVL